MTKQMLLWFILFVFLFSGKISAHSKTQIVEMTANGFEPQRITVDENASIIFINKDRSERWPASNVHPTHELYPEFDPRRPIQKGESWVFKPTKIGEWKYHDHLFSHMRGVITVVREKNVAQKSPAAFTFLQNAKNAIGNLLATVKNLFSFKNTVAKERKLLSAQAFKNLSPARQESEIRQIAQTVGPRKGWDYIKGIFKNNAGSKGNIHDLAHLAGILLYEVKGFSGIKDCSSEFAFGCFHGFLDKAFAKDLDHLLDAEKSCLTLGPKSSGPVASCIHGIGHGVASFYSTNNLEKSLTTCRKLSSGNEYCFDGIFMEFVRSASDSFFKISDPYYPCNSLEKKYGYAYSFACGRNQPSLLMGRFQMGFDEVVGVCVDSDSKPFKNACFDSLGFSLAATGDVEQILAGCQKIGIDEFTAKCLKAAAGELVFQEVPGWFEKSKQVCLGWPQSQSDCQEHVDRLIREYNKKVSYQLRSLTSGEDTNAYIREQLQVCYETGGRDGCYNQVAKVLYDTFGLSNTLTLLKANEQSPEVYARCHEVTHYLSRFEYEKQKNIAKVYGKCDSTCHGGCYHGTIEAYLKEKDENEQTLQRYFPKVCGSAKDYQKPIEFNECLHGMGHAAMFVTDMELRKSLTLCDTLSEQEKHKERCFTGVFMENSSSSTSFDHASRYIKKDDPFYPCNALEEEYQSVCWQYQSSYFSILSNQDWGKVAKLCSQIPSQYQDRCFRTIGTNQVGFTLSLETMKRDCDLMPTEHFKDVCVAGVVSSLSYRFAGDTQKLIDFCMLSDLPHRESCFKQIGTSIQDWDNDKALAKKECLKIPDPQEVSWCLSAI